MPMDLEIAFFETGENIDFDWPETLGVERSKIAIAEIAVAVLAFAGLVLLVLLTAQSNPAKVLLES
jgi:hypothetical protein